jgi:hypothetical protein
MTQLRLLIQGFADSLQAVIWIFILFLFIVFFAGIFVTTVIGHNATDWLDCPDAAKSGLGWSPCEDESGNRLDDAPDCCEDYFKIRDCFGTLPQSMFTMFRFVTLDDWADVSMTVMDQMIWMGLFFVIYILITAFAVIALLTGVMAERVSCRSNENEKTEEKRSFKEWVETQKEHFLKSPLGPDGEPLGLTLDDLRNDSYFELDRILEKVQGDRSGISRDDVDDLFKALDLSGDGRVTWEEFKYGMKHIYGDASARDIAILRADVNKVLKKLEKWDGFDSGGMQVAPWEQKTESLEKRMERIERLLRELVAGIKGEPPSRKLH